MKISFGRATCFSLLQPATPASRRLSLSARQRQLVPPTGKQSPFMTEHFLTDLTDQISHDNASHVAVGSSVSSPLNSTSEASFKHLNQPEVREQVFLSQSQPKPVVPTRRRSTLDSQRPPGEGLFNFPIVEVVVDGPHEAIAHSATPSSTQSQTWTIQSDPVPAPADHLVEDYSLELEHHSARYAEGPFMHPPEMSRRQAPSSALSEWGTASAGASPRTHQPNIYHDQDHEMTESDAHNDAFTDSASILDPSGLDLDDIGLLRHLAEANMITRSIREAIFADAEDLCTFKTSLRSFR